MRVGAARPSSRPRCSLKCARPGARGSVLVREARLDRVEARFHIAARAYRFYGIVYLVGGLWLGSRGVGVRGGPAASPWRAMALWGVAGLFFLVAIPYLLTARQRWFGTINRQHIAIVVALFLAVRAWKVGAVVLGP